MKHCLPKNQGRNGTSKNPVKTISISIPVRILERVDALVGSVHATRSGLILHHIINGLHQEELYLEWLETQPPAPKSEIVDNAEIFIDKKGRKWWVGEPEPIKPLGRADGYLRPSEFKGAV